MKQYSFLLELFFDDAETAVDEKNIDFSKVKKLEKYEDLLQAVNDWVSGPDRKLLPKLEKLGNIIDSMYHFKPMIIYRGFHHRNHFQDHMGLCDEGFFGSKLKKGIKPGYKFKYKTNNPLSFSTDMNICKGFGNVIIKTKLPKKKLVITDELCYIISKKIRNRNDVATQKEVVVFPNQELECEVLKI